MQPNNIVTFLSCHKVVTSEVITEIINVVTKTELQKYEVAHSDDIINVAQFH